jgi:hypothetical protein
MATSILSAITYARQLASTDSNGISDTLGLAFANDTQNDVIRELTERNINAAKLTFPVASVLSANTTSFTWPSDLYALKTIEINYTDSNQQNYIQAENVEISNTQSQSFDWLRLNQPTTQPLFANYGPTWEAFPTPKVAASVKFVYFTLPTEYPDVGTAIPYPLTLDYRVLGVGIAKLYKMSLDEFSSSQSFDIEYKKRINKIINILAPASQQPITAEPIHLSGYEF